MGDGSSGEERQQQTVERRDTAMNSSAEQTPGHCKRRSNGFQSAAAIVCGGERLLLAARSEGTAPSGWPPVAHHVMQSTQLRLSISWACSQQHSKQQRQQKTFSEGIGRHLKKDIMIHAPQHAHQLTAPPAEMHCSSRSTLHHSSRREQARLQVLALQLTKCARGPA